MITLPLIFATAFSGRHFHVTQCKSLEIQTCCMVLYYNRTNPVELKHCEMSSSCRVFYLMKLKPEKKGNISFCNMVTSYENQEYQVHVSTHFFNDDMILFMYLCSYHCARFADLCMARRLSWIFRSSMLSFVLEKLWTFVLGTKQSVRITSVQFHSFGSRIYLVHFNVCRKPGLAGPETLN